MSSQGLNSLATIIKRLEAATSRLEDITITQSGGSFVPPAVTNARPVSTANALTSSQARPSTPPSSGPVVRGHSSPGTAPDSVPRSVSSYDDLILNDKLVTFVGLTNSLNQKGLTEQAEIISGLFKNLRAVLLCASACMKPNDADYAAMLQPMAKELVAISKIKDENRSNKEFSFHFQAVTEGSPCVGWIQLPGGPGDFIKEQKNSAEYYTNRVIKEFKDKDKKHVDWARSYIGLIDALFQYVQEYHKTGLTWNPKGGKAIDFKLAAAALTAQSNHYTTSISPPPPPPPPPPAPTDMTSSDSDSGLTGAAAVFSQINQGTDVTKRLNKVDPSQMTHKNPSIRRNEPVPALSPSPSSKVPPKPKKPMALQGKKPPKLELQQNKWLIEYQENEPELVLKDVTLSQGVNLFGCKNTVVRIDGKVNAISMTNCHKTSLLVDSVVSSVSITNSGSFQLQILGRAPTIQIDATDSGQVYLSKGCLDAEIFTAKCSAINISIPVEGEDDGIFVEKPIPEMLRTVVKGGKLSTSIVEHSG